MRAGDGMLRFYPTTGARPGWGTMTDESPWNTEYERRNWTVEPPSQPETPTRKTWSSPLVGGPVLIRGFTLHRVACLRA